MKRVLAFSLGLVLLALPALTEPFFKTVSATATSQTITLGGDKGTVTIVNADSTNEIYFRLFNTNDTIAAATTLNAILPAGASISFTRSQTAPALYRALSIVCDTAETATVYVYSE